MAKKSKQTFPIEPLLTPRRASRKLAISKKDLKALVTKGFLKALRIEGKLRIDPLDLLQYIDAFKTPIVPVWHEESLVRGFAILSAGRSLTEAGCDFTPEALHWLTANWIKTEADLTQQLNGFLGAIPRGEDVDFENRYLGLLSAFKHEQQI